MMIKNDIKGFTLIEVVIFIVITSIIASVILRAGSVGLLSSGDSKDQMTANMLAQKCMEWMLGNRRLNGYNIYSCPSTPSETQCANVTGFTVAESVQCTTISGNTNFKTLTVVVSGNGDATLRTLIANY